MSRIRFHLTRRAALDLRDIHQRSRERWGEKTARDYIDKLYAVMGSLKADDSRAKQREKRSLPFCMVPAESHFIVYEMIGNAPVIITILHQRRDIESIIRDFTPAFLAEIAALRQTSTGQP